MSFFTTLGIPHTAALPHAEILESLHRVVARTSPCSFAKEFGAEVMYGLSGPVWEVELHGTAEDDLESALLDLPDPDTKRRAYIRAGQMLGREVHELRDDPQVDERFLSIPQDLPVFRLLEELAERTTARPIVLNLDVDFEVRLGNFQTLVGLPAIRLGVWRAVALTDLASPLRLIIP